ncbi:hypothetical protein QBC36DRAFT_362135 [Triangularia setosa]|uniref:Uncharacterized protein n=1 Tax=Triangularia setosa TaxID=2587417 RepID=A0AAN7AB14_9PEZI|nr:hypothetical protein QBC36DRAFT_362135 [Podospora setosa]
MYQPKKHEQKASRFYIDPQCNGLIPSILAAVGRYFTASRSHLPNIASSCYDAYKTLARLYKKDLRSRVNGPFPLFDVAQDMLVISPIHTGSYNWPRVSYPSIPLSFDTVGSVGHWKQQYPLAINDLPATGSLANITSIAIYLKPKMDDGVVCRPTQWLWADDACPNLEKIYILNMNRPLLQQDFSAIKKNHLVAGR